MNEGKRVLTSALPLLHWTAGELDASIPPALAFAGVWHLVIAAAGAERLAELDAVVLDEVG